jgi:hypothetical protein
VAYFVLILLLDLPKLWGWGGLRISEDVEGSIDVFQHGLAPVEQIITLEVRVVYACALVCTAPPKCAWMLARASCCAV